jgi:hypothetical protein
VKAVQDLIEAEKGQSFAKLSDAEAGLYKQNIRTAEAAILDISKQDPATGNAMAKIIL